MINTDKYEKYKSTQSNYQTSDRYIKELLTEIKRLRYGIRSILSDYDITELIRDVPEDEWNFEQQALIRMKEMIE